MGRLDKTTPIQSPEENQDRNKEEDNVVPLFANLLPCVYPSRKRIKTPISSNRKVPRARKVSNKDTTYQTDFTTEEDWDHGEINVDAPSEKIP